MKKRYIQFLQTVGIVMGITMGWPLSSFAQEAPKPRLAIVDFSITSQEQEHAQLEKIVPEWLTAFFVKDQTFNVIERRQLEAILQEQTLSQTGLLDEQSAAKVGQVLGVDMLVTGTIISVADTLEVTARIVDAETGTILGIESVTADDVEELRDEIGTLGNALSNALGEESVPENVPLSEQREGATFDREGATFDREGAIFDSMQWGVEFIDGFSAKDQANTRWSQKDDVLVLNGTYTEENEERLIWIYPLPDEIYTSIEVKFRVMELEGVVSLCAEAGWNNDMMWSGICPHFEDEYADITLYIENDGSVEQEEELNIDGIAGKWYRIRQEYRDDQFHYYLDDRLLTTFSLDTPINTLEDFWIAMSLYLGEASTIHIEFDDILVR